MIYHRMRSFLLVLYNITAAAQLYAPQTKILEGRTNISECVFDEPSNVIGDIHGYRVVGSVDEMDDDATDGGCDSGGGEDSGCRSLTFAPP